MSTSSSVLYPDPDGGVGVEEERGVIASQDVSKEKDEEGGIEKVVAATATKAEISADAADVDL